MHKLKSFAFIALFGIAALGLMPSPAKAAVIYFYTGNNYTNVNDNIPLNGSYTTSMSISGSFTVAAPLLSLAALTDISASILSFSFFDGRQTLDDTNTGLADFLLGTDSAGMPTTWSIDLFNTFPTPTVTGDQSQRIRIRSPAGVSDQAGIGECTLAVQGLCSAASGDNASVFEPGSWRVRTVAVPEPSTLLLFGVGLAGLAGFARRRRA